MSRRIPVAAVLLCGLGLIALALSATPVAAKNFTDIPNDYWAKPWIDSISEQGIAHGFPGGDFRPEEQVTRGQMAVFLGRTMEALKHTRGLGWIQPAEAPDPGYIVYAPVFPEASDYRLYTSANGVDFTVVSATPTVGLEFVSWYLPTASAQASFQPVAVLPSSDEDDEADVAASKAEPEKLLTQLLTLRPGAGVVPITLDSPIGTSESRMPILEWGGVPKAVVYLITVEPAGGGSQEYAALTEGWLTSLRYHQVLGPGLLWGWAGDPKHLQPLAGNADYVLTVRGIDAGGYAFSLGRATFHTLP